MYLKDESLVVEFDGRLQVRHEHTATPQFVLDPTALTGFFDGPGTKRDTTSRPVAWGDFKEPAYKHGRLMSVTGTAIANNAVELQLLRDDFVSLYSDGGYGEMRVLNSAGVRYMYVGVEGTPRWEVQYDNVATFKLDLYAPDPRMYGPEFRALITDRISTGGLDFPLDFPVDFAGPQVHIATTAANYGNVDAWPKFVVTGDYFFGFEITNGSSKVVRYEGMVSRSSPVTIDMGAGTAIQNGVDKSNLLTRRDWFPIPPNSSIQPVFHPIQDAFGWCDIIYRDTWI